MYAGVKKMYRILVIEDDVRFLKYVNNALTDDGHTVDACSSLDAALEKLPGDFNLIITDVCLENGDTAHDIVIAANSIWPAPPVIVMSGGASAAEAFNLKDLGAALYLEKPMKMQELCEVVRQFDSTFPTYANVKEEAATRTVGNALKLKNMNKRAAARTLKTTRQVIQAVERAAKRSE